MKRDCRFCGTPANSIGLGSALFLMFCACVLGATSILLAHSLDNRKDAPQLVVCESGSFEHAREAGDPYLRERATCNANDSNGKPVNVVVID